jgi:hypothetical protein
MLLDRGFIKSLAVIDARANTPEEETVKDGGIEVT